MTLSDGPLTFDLQNSRDCLEDLRAAISDFKTNRLNPRQARYIAIVAWSISDWVFREHGNRLGYENLENFKKDIRSQCRELCYLQDLANSLKHRTISRYTPSLAKAHKHGGAFSQGFSRAFDLSRLMLTTRDGRELWFEDVIETALIFWDGYFRDKGV